MLGSDFAFSPSYVASAVVFALVFAILYPLMERYILGARPTSLGRRAGIALFAGGIYGMVDLIKAWGLEGPPSPSVWAIGVGLAVLMVAGFVIMRATSPRGDAAKPR